MATESAFLGEIADKPDDLTLRLVYADWLEERSEKLAQVRAETIRVETEMQALPVYSARFWELKPRRESLRARRDRAWLVAMGYHDRYDVCLRHGIPRGWKERLRLARAFASVWLNRPLPDIGGRRDQVAVAETQLGLSLPPAAQEWVAFAADVGDVVKRLRHPHPFDLDMGVVLEHLPDFGGFTIPQDHPDGCSLNFLVRDADARQPDPKLTLILGLEGNTPEYQELPNDTWGDRVSTFVLGRALGGVRGSPSFSGFVPDSVTEPFLKGMRSAFPAHVRVLGREWFEAPELLVSFIRVPQHPGPGWTVRGVARQPSQAVPAAVPAAFWEFLDAMAEDLRHNSRGDEARRFHAAFNKAASPRASAGRLILVDG
jgi:uncharacterized protein (TIGR02996 family)